MGSEDCEAENISSWDSSRAERRIRPSATNITHLLQLIDRYGSIQFKAVPVYCLLGFSYTVEVNSCIGVLIMVQFNTNYTMYTYWQYIIFFSLSVTIRIVLSTRKTQTNHFHLSSPTNFRWIRKRNMLCATANRRKTDLSVMVPTNSRLSRTLSFRIRTHW